MGNGLQNREGGRRISKTRGASWVTTFSIAREQQNVQPWALDSAGRSIAFLYRSLSPEAQQAFKDGAPLEWVAAMEGITLSYITN